MFYKPATGTIFDSHTTVRMEHWNMSLPAVLDDATLAALGVFPLVEGARPVADPMTHRIEPGQVVENDGVYVRNWNTVALTAEEIAQKQADALSAAKAARHTQIAAIVVTTSSGNAFDGDEKSQDRMARALAAMDEADTLPWVLHDNTVATVERSELREALRLAGAEMAAIWVGVYA